MEFFGELFFIIIIIIFSVFVPRLILSPLLLNLVIENKIVVRDY